AATGGTASAYGRSRGEPASRSHDGIPPLITALCAHPPGTVCWSPAGPSTPDELVVDTGVGPARLARPSWHAAARANTARMTVTRHIRVSMTLLQGRSQSARRAAAAAAFPSAAR